ncbi:hypothetical protein ACEXOS_015410 [Herbiconiux sp. P16]|uniref:hypothetical protein n=1 Tax=Herbiconiux wuyangfengii TaxID=3342794 RepID=UPI0035BAE3DA
MVLVVGWATPVVGRAAPVVPLVRVVGWPKPVVLDIRSAHPDLLPRAARLPHIEPGMSRKMDASNTGRPHLLRLQGASHDPSSASAQRAAAPWDTEVRGSAAETRNRHIDKLAPVV